MAYGGFLKSIGVKRPPEAKAAPAPEPATRAAANGRGTGGPAECWEDVIARLQARRGSHVIGLVHGHPLREDDLSWFWREMIGRRQTEDFLSAIRDVPPDAPLDIVLHSFGGLFGAVQQIARAIKTHRGPTTVIVPHYAQHYATLLALAGDKLVMGPNAVMSFIEPFDETLEQVVRQKGVRNVDDFTIMRLHVERAFSRETRALVCELAHDGAHQGRCRLARDLAGGTNWGWSPMTVADARKAGLTVSTEIPSEAFELIRANRSCPVGDHGVKTGPAPQDVKPPTAQLQAGVETIWRAHAGLRQWPTAFQAPTPLPQRDAPRSAPAETAPADGQNCPLPARPLIARMEAQRGTRVLCVIHEWRMESTHVDLLTAEDVLSALATIDPNVPLDVILDTPGGHGFEGEQIARAIKSHKGRKTVFVPFFGMSAGTIIALAADEIVMSDHAALGPIDAQFGGIPTGAILSVLDTKPPEKIGDNVLAIGLLCRRNVKEDHARAVELMAGTYPTSLAHKIARRLNEGDLSHGYPLTYPAARQIGLKVSNAMPSEPIDIVRAFRRQRDGGRSVLWCP